MAILPTKLVSATFLLRISFVIVVRKRDIKKLFVLSNSRNSDFHGKICQHLLLPLHQKPKHVSIPLKLSLPRVISIRMLRRKSTMLTRGRCFKPMSLKFKLFKMNSNLLGHSIASHTIPWLGSMFFPMVTILVTPEFATSFFLSYFALQEASVALKVSTTRKVI
jgi:hypothetical protein